MCKENLIFLFLNQNICCGYSKEPSQCDGSSFEHPKHVKIDGLEIIYKFTLKIFVYLKCIIFQIQQVLIGKQM